MSPIIDLGNGQSLLLLCPTGAGGVRDSVTAALKNSWKKIPPADTAAILCKLRRISLMFTGPIGVCRKVEACIDIVFNSIALQELPGGEAWVELIVAHELAHAFLYATGDSSHLAAGPSEDEKELAVEVKLGLWGYDKNEHAKAIRFVLDHSCPS